jgi:hypothetical protein
VIDGTASSADKYGNYKCKYRDKQPTFEAEDAGREILPYG